MEKASKSEPSALPRHKTRRWVRGLLIVVSALLAIPVLAYCYWVAFEHRLYTLNEGTAYRAAQMSPERVVQTAREQGLRTVIDLRRQGPEVDAERIALESIGVEHVHISAQQVPTQESVDRFLSVVRRPDVNPLLLHCNHGVGRAGVFSAIYRMELEGWSNEEALAEARRLGGYGGFGNESPKGRFILNYQPTK